MAPSAHPASPRALPEGVWGEPPCLAGCISLPAHPCPGGASHRSCVQGSMAGQSDLVLSKAAREGPPLTIASLWPSLQPGGALCCHLHPRLCSAGAGSISPPVIGGCHSYEWPGTFSTWGAPLYPQGSPLTLPGGSSDRAQALGKEGE